MFTQVVTNGIANNHRRFRASLCAGVALSAVLVASVSPPVFAQQAPGKYYMADGSRTNDLKQAILSWRTPEFLKNHALAGVKSEYAYVLGITGKGVNIGQVDSGVLADHPELQGQFTALTVEGGI